MCNVEESDSAFTLNFLNRLSPRSNEACKRLGILATELAVRPFESFAEAGLSAEIQKLRYQEYEQYRKGAL